MSVFEKKEAFEIQGIITYPCQKSCPLSIIRRLQAGGHFSFIDNNPFCGGLSGVRKCEELLSEVVCSRSYRAAADGCRPAERRVLSGWMNPGRLRVATVSKVLICLTLVWICCIFQGCFLFLILPVSAPIMLMNIKRFFWAGLSKTFYAISIFMFHCLDALLLYLYQHFVNSLLIDCTFFIQSKSKPTTDGVQARVPCHRFVGSRWESDTINHLWGVMGRDTENTEWELYHQRMEDINRREWQWKRPFAATRVHLNGTKIR